MKVWKQLFLCAAVLAAAAGIWANFAPDARETLASWGIDWAVASVREEPAGTANGASGSRNASRDVTVVTMPAATATINDQLKAIGNGRANATVVVTPYASGRLVAFSTQSGAHVRAGDVIARLDADTETIALERAKIARDSSQAKVERMRALRSSSAVTAVQLTDAELELRNSELSVHDAQLALDRRSVVAPIDGIVGILPIEAGNYVTSQSAIATIDDRTSILVDFWVPERFAAAVRIGSELSATPLSNLQAQFKGTVSAIDNRIDEKSRTLWVQAKIDNPADSLRAGMSFDIVMRFAGETYPAVSPLAIQWGSDGAFIWVVRDGKAKSLPVQIVQRNTQNVLVQAELSPGDQVVTEGVQSVRDGGTVRVAQRGQQESAQAGGS